MGYRPFDAPRELQLEWDGRPIGQLISPFSAVKPRKEGTVLDAVWSLPKYFYEAKEVRNADSDSEFAPQDADGILALSLIFPKEATEVTGVAQAGALSGADLYVQRDYSTDEVYRKAFTLLEDACRDAGGKCPLTCERAPSPHPGLRHIRFWLRPLRERNAMGLLGRLHSRVSPVGRRQAALPPWRPV